MKAFAKITAIILVVVGILVIVGGFVAAVSLMVSHGIALRGDLDLPMGRIQRAVPMMSGVGTGLVSFLAGLVLTAMGQILYLLVKIAERQDHHHPVTKPVAEDAAITPPVDNAPNQMD